MAPKRLVLAPFSFPMIKWSKLYVAFVMSPCWIKAVSLVSELFKIEWESAKQKEDRLRDSILWPLWQDSHCRGNSFDKEQKQPLSSKATYRELSEELDMLNTHYLSHLSSQSRWNDKSGPLNLPRRRRNVPQEDGEVLLLKQAPEKLPASRCSRLITTACQELK